MANRPEKAEFGPRLSGERWSSGAKRAHQSRPGRLRTVMCDLYEEMSRSLVLVTTEVVRLGDVCARTVRSTKNELEVVIEAPQAGHQQV